MAVLGANEILDIGLQMAGADENQRDTALNTRLGYFRTAYGSHPLVYARIWDDLYQTGIDSERKVNYFFLSLFWMKEYDKERDLALRFHYNEETIRTWTWYYAECIQEL